MEDLTRLLIAARTGDRGALEAAVRASQPDVVARAREDFIVAWQAAEST